MTILSVEGLGKSYRVYRSQWLRFGRWFGLPIRPTEEHWVLRGVDFSIGAGEAVGIVGDNGAGKSTLLKMITGTLQPTEGCIRVNGRIAAILELGMGFNAELTGRQNVYHAAGLMGFDSARIAQAMPDIEAFAEIGEYFDQAVRTYSSGMQMRVAFAVATAFRPDILIVDEALSVGDAYFQHKCMQRIRLYQSQGTTLLLVSHSPDTVRTLCQRAILLEHGSVAKVGDAASVMDYYRARQVMLTSEVRAEHVLDESCGKSADRDSKYILSSKSSGAVGVTLTGENPVIRSGDSLSIAITVRFQQDHADPHIGFGIRTKMGVVIYETNTYTLSQDTASVAAGESRTVVFHFACHLSPGTYELEVGVADGGYGEGSFREAIFFDQSFLVFEVAVGEQTGWAGLYNIQPRVTVSS